MAAVLAVWGTPCTQTQPLLSQNTLGSAPGQSLAGTPGADTGTSA